ncbi:universal stress protein [Cellulomonas sp. ATA003]|uniref:universal stress protein n=1 Tax=Cellulomonas sp. ATA003 TaxID=3073064 RepID=UPI0028739C34|nr:universal stress protein [Cellulomonas sp. ATA003]WNB86958.1 universal stress protein [Cellulomonas sp. ATA003]
MASALRAEHPRLDVRLELVDDDPAHALTQMSHGAVLLVVGSRGLGAFRGMLLGSVSNEVVRSAPGTVLVVHDVTG